MELKIDDDFKNLIPPLKEEELTKLEKNILQDGIRDKLVVWKDTIIDGHNRYDIAKKHDLKFEVRRLHFLSKEEAINWMLNNQLGRRNLTPQQRVDVLFQAEELIKSIYEKGKIKSGERTDLTFCSTDQKVERKPHNSREEIAKLAQTSPATVGRMRKIKKEDPEAYKEVVGGKKSVYTAYNDLPTVTNKYAERDGFVKKHERGEKQKPRTSKPQKEMTKEEKQKVMFEANVETLFMHLEEVDGFIGRNKDYKEIINGAIKKDKATMKDYKKTLKIILKEMGEI